MSEVDRPGGMDRRKFLTVLGATGGGALAMSGCSTSRIEKLVPYLVQSEDQIPGVATWYASTCTECEAGCGVHVRTREGRAVKLEGNPEHPVNRGKLCSRGQAALQGLYNPGRIKSPMARKADGTFGEITWDDAIGRLAGKLGAAGGKLAVLSGAGPGSFSDFLAEWTADGAEDRGPRGLDRVERFAYLHDADSSGPSVCAGSVGGVAASVGDFGPSPPAARPSGPYR